MSNTTSKTFLDNIDVDAFAEQLDVENEAKLHQPSNKAVDYVDALSRLTTVEEAWRKAITDRDIALAAHNEGIKLLRLRVQAAREIADALRPRRPRGRPRLTER